MPLLRLPSIRRAGDVDRVDSPHVSQLGVPLLSPRRRRALATAAASARARRFRGALEAAVSLAIAACGSVLLFPRMEAYTGEIGRVVAEMREALNPSDRPYRLIFACQVPHSLPRMLFPEYDRALYSLSSGVKPTSRDILIAEYGPAEAKCAPLSRDLRGHILNFPGRMVFTNSEAADTQEGPRGIDNSTEDGRVKLRDACPDAVRCVDLQGAIRSQEGRYSSGEGGTARFNYLPPSDRAVVLGSHRDVPGRSVRVRLAAKLLALASPDGDADLRWMTDPSRRPRNSGRHFAAFFATNCVPYRDVAAKRIAQLGTLHVGRNYGRCAGRVPDPSDDVANGGPPPAMELPPRPTSRPRDPLANKDVLREYKFALVMENTYREGYLTEKLVAAFAAGTVPIWYGGVDALEIFNPEAMVFYDVEDPEPAVERIKYLMENEEAYREVQEAPILKDGARTVERYFSLRDEIGGGRLKRKIRRAMGIGDAGAPEEDNDEGGGGDGGEAEEDDGVGVGAGAGGEIPGTSGEETEADEEGEDRAGAAAAAAAWSSVLA